MYQTPETGPDVGAGVGVGVGAGVGAGVGVGVAEVGAGVGVGLTPQLAADIEGVLDVPTAQFHPEPISPVWVRTCSAPAQV